ncbi:MAG TPA: carbamoyl phosphate synthase large subunit, partial [Gemmatimonadetes bacterium]|nr:carbamoyl phosphate synthase large subunit [Gemmatimonadota bacterium]
RTGWVVGSELKDDGLEAEDRNALLSALRRPTAHRPFQLKRALKSGLTVDEIFEATKIDPWFLDQLLQIIEWERSYAEAEEITPEITHAMKREGFSDIQLAALRGEDEATVRERRWSWDIHPTYNVVDT